MPRVIHFDIAASDPQRAIDFYRQALGWTITKARGPIEYWLIQTGDQDKPGIDGGLAHRDADWQRITMFVDVPSVDAAARKIQAAGGRVVQPRAVIPGVGYVIACEDTEGNIFAIIEQNQTAGF